MAHYDLVAIGSGPAGEKGAVLASYFGRKVAVVERSPHLGGACINSGTIPSKTMRESALYFSGLRQRGLYGIDYSLRSGLTMNEFLHRTESVVQEERRKIERNLSAHQVDLLRGSAAFEGPKAVRITRADGSTWPVYGEHFLIASGSRPFRPPDIPFDDIAIFDSDSILRMEKIPGSLLVVGGGVIGCEYASIFTALNVQVSLVDGRDRLLPFLDAEIAERLRKHLADLGMQFYFNERVSKVERTPAGVKMTLRSGKVLEGETAMIAAGRRGVTEDLALDKAGVATNDRGLITVNEYYQTSVPHIYAAGDVVGFPALASVSMEQGRASVGHMFNIPYKYHMATLLPMGIYTVPEISSLGESEETCKEKGIDYVVGRGRYANNARGMITGDESGMVKLVFQRSDKRLLGVHIIGEGATELIHIGMMVAEAGEAIDAFVNTVFNYPTLSDCYKYAAYDGLGNLSGHKLREG